MFGVVLSTSSTVPFQVATNFHVGAHGPNAASMLATA